MPSLLVSLMQAEEYRPGYGRRNTQPTHPETRTAGAMGMRQHGWKRIAVRLGAERSLVQIQSPRRDETAGFPPYLGP